MSAASVMKLISFLSAAALLGLGAFFFDVSLGIFAATASILFLLSVIRDYAPRRPYWQPRSENLVPFRRFPRQGAMPLAA
ncbi:MAG TPA: hypothetical protein PLU52_01160 [Opitutaceae bacterium]|nr:hypothetical protein [Opitutaceae bacterium]HND59966.1 hypothetical protein [Opitutaceae bacterium]